MTISPRKLKEFYGIPVDAPLPECMKSNLPDAENRGLVLNEEAWPPPLRNYKDRRCHFVYGPDGKIHDYTLDWNPYPDDAKFYPTKPVLFDALEIVCNYYGIAMTKSSRVTIWPEEMSLGTNSQTASIGFSNGEIRVKTCCNQISRYATIWVMLNP